MNTKYIFVVGGVYSGTGKGISCASLGLLMKMRGHTVQCVKFDPYLNTSASVLSPSEHGEVWVTEDGWECDLDIGSYERITGIPTSRENIYTSGELHKELIKEHEEGKFLGQTIQVIPHLVNKFKEKIQNRDCEICIIELGGTVGDIESAGFYEAIRAFRQENYNNTLVVMVAPVLWVPTINEFKTKPLQNSIRDLQRHGIQADILLCRTSKAIPDKLLDKISGLTNIHRECVFEAPDVSSIYQVPLEFFNRHIDDLIADKFKLKRNGCRIHKYKDLVEKYVNGKEELLNITIGIVGKYDNCDEAYLSLKEALYHAAVSNNVKVNIRWISSEEVEGKKRNLESLFEGIQCMIVPGGFDCRGVEGKIKAAQYARENKIPFLGICLGLQCSVIEFARNVCEMNGANSLEFDPQTNYPVIHFVEGQKDITKKSGTMRLGAYECLLEKESLSYDLYKKRTISERHRHRYEVNDQYLDVFAKNNFFVSGRSTEGNLVEIMELSRKLHPFYVGTQAHPEFKSRLGNPAPLFDGLISAAVKCFAKVDR